MPTYHYQCGCGVQFSSPSPLAENKKPKKCPVCGQWAARKPPSEVQGSYDFQVDGSGPQNTGISDLDAHIDRVIGQHAKQGWATIEERMVAKAEVLANNPGATLRDLGRNPEDGSYAPIRPEERAIQERAIKLELEAQKTLKAQLSEEE